MNANAVLANWSTNPVEDMENAVNKMNEADTSYQRKKWFEIALALWNEFPAVRALWDYFDTARKYVARFVRKTAEKVKQVIDCNLPPRMRVEWNGIAKMAEGVQQCYLIRLLDRNRELIWSKVGTTTKPTQQRMSQHLSYYKKDGVKFVEVVRLWDCNGVDAEGAESMFRAHYIMKHPGTFRKNDRFTGVEFDLDEADRLMQNYLRKRA